MKVDPGTVVASLRKLLAEADLDELAELYSRYCVDGPVSVGDERYASDEFENGKRVNTEDSCQKESA